MFKRKVEDSGKSTIFQYAFKIFFVHIINVVIMFVFLALVTSIDADHVFLSENMIYTILTAICFVFYVIAVYVESWRTGERDYNLVLYEHIEYMKLKPLYAVLVSQIPGIVFALLMQFPFSNFDIQRFVRFFYLNFIYPLMILDDTHGIKAAYFIPLAFAAVPALSGYFLGYHGKRILDRIMFLKPGDKKRRDLR